MGSELGVFDRFPWTTMSFTNSERKSVWEIMIVTPSLVDGQELLPQ